MMKELNKTTKRNNMSRDGEAIRNDMANYKGNKSKKAYRKLKAELKAFYEQSLVNDIEQETPAEESSSTSPTKGLGDIVESVIKTTGLDKLAPKDCGCKERVKDLNELGSNVVTFLSRVFRGSSIKDLNPKDYAYLCNFFKDGLKGSKDVREIDMLFSIYNRVSRSNKKRTSCNTCNVQIVKALHELYTAYNG